MVHNWLRTKGSIRACRCEVEGLYERDDAEKSQKDKSVFLSPVQKTVASNVANYHTAGGIGSFDELEESQADKTSLATQLGSI